MVGLFKDIFNLRQSQGKPPPSPARVEQPHDPSGVAPPLLENVFGRPPSYTYTNDYISAPISSSGGPPIPAYSSPASPHQSVSLQPPQRLNTIPEIPDPSIDPVRVPFLSSGPSGLNDTTFKAIHADAVSTFAPDVHPVQLVVGSSKNTNDADIEATNAGANGVGPSVRPPTRRALNVYSQDVTGWQSRLSTLADKEVKEVKGDGDTDTEKEAMPLGDPQAAVAPFPLETNHALTEAYAPAETAPPRNPIFQAPDRTFPGAPLPSQEPGNETGIGAPTPEQLATIESMLKKPTCSLNLICYRPGSQGCVLQQIRVISRSRYTSDTDYTQAIKADPSLITSDQEFFARIRQEYNTKICNFWRRHLSLKTLRHIRLLSYTPTTRPTIVPLDDFTLQEVFHAYNNPETVTTDSSWIEWVFRLRQKDRRHALEFVEGWSGFRIGIVGSVPWVLATVVGVAWTARGGDAQTAFTVAGFLLTVGTSLLALLAIVSKVES
ncbi:hypothetical protein BCR34DRAFT_605497 [Clohesyomyces aquaticus]|uniref:Transmembrane protein n=1 Tax=Clohesyomyces aquaticus TaxID=1231657 RepID=A0A1Y1YXA2_9PLEO|nr:hypothetical protein BCR34DRAFT_605497 [Clohesyomyces aquaticus]